MSNNNNSIAESLRQHDKELCGFGWRELDTQHGMFTVKLFFRKGQRIFICDKRELLDVKKIADTLLED